MTRVCTLATSHAIVWSQPATPQPRTESLESAPTTHEIDVSDLISHCESAIYIGTVADVVGMIVDPENLIALLGAMGSVSRLGSPDRDPMAPMPVRLGAHRLGLVLDDGHARGALAPCVTRDLLRSHGVDARRRRQALPRRVSRASQCRGVRRRRDRREGQALLVLRLLPLLRRVHRDPQARRRSMIGDIPLPRWIGGYCPDCGRSFPEGTPTHPHTRMVSGEEALAMLTAAPGPLVAVQTGDGMSDVLPADEGHVIGSDCPTAYATLFAAAPDLARTVAALHGEVAELRAAVRALSDAEDAYDRARDSHERARLDGDIAAAKAALQLLAGVTR